MRSLVGAVEGMNLQREPVIRGFGPLAHHVTILHVDRSTRRHRAQLFHTELRRDRPRPLVVVVDARDDPLQPRRVERPGEDQLAGVLGEPAALRSDAQRRGLAKNACQLILAWAFDTARLERVIACIDDDNEGARSIATKLGMKELCAMPPSRTVYVKYRDVVR